MPLKYKYHAWYSFSNAQYAGAHLFYCDRHKLTLNGEHCRICYINRLRLNGNLPASSRPLCKEKCGSIDGQPIIAFTPHVIHEKKKPVRAEAAPKPKLTVAMLKERLKKAKEKSQK